MIICINLYCLTLYVKIDYHKVVPNFMYYLAVSTACNHTRNNNQHKYYKLNYTKKKNQLKI